MFCPLSTSCTGACSTHTPRYGQVSRLTSTEVPDRLLSLLWQRQLHEHSPKLSETELRLLSDANRKLLFRHQHRDRKYNFTILGVSRGGPADLHGRCLVSCFVTYLYVVAVSDDYFISYFTRYAYTHSSRPIVVVTFLNIVRHCFSRLFTFSFRHRRRKNTGLHSTVSCAHWVCSCLRGRLSAFICDWLTVT